MRFLFDVRALAKTRLPHEREAARVEWEREHYSTTLSSSRRGEVDCGSVAVRPIVQWWRGTHAWRRAREWALDCECWIVVDESGRHELLYKEVRSMLVGG